MGKVEERSAERFKNLSDIMKANNDALRDVMKANNDALRDIIINTQYVLGCFMGLGVMAIGLLFRYYSIEADDKRNEKEEKK